jgi:hypothetical protein
MAHPRKEGTGAEEWEEIRFGEKMVPKRGEDSTKHKE